MPRHLPKPLANRADVETLIKKNRSRDNSIGDLCLWTISEIEISPEKLDEMLEMNGISADWAPVSNRPKTVVRKALTRIRPLLEDRNNNLHVLVRRVAETENHLRYGLVNEVADDKAFDLDYSMSNQVIFDKHSGELTFTGKVVPQIMDEYNRLLGVFTSREVLKMTQNIVLGYGGLPMRDGSGMFFLPYGMREVTEALRNMFNVEFQPYLERGGVSFFRALGVTGDVESREEMGAIALADINPEIDGIISSIKDAQGRVMDTGDVSSLTLTSLTQKYKIAYSRLSMYKQLLEMNTEEAERKLEEAQTAMNALLLGAEQLT
jgi:hypothetical protein